MNTILNAFNDINRKGFSELEVAEALRPLVPEDKTHISDELKAEVMAFNFTENYQDQETGWGTYFGPMMVWNNGDWTTSESPSLKLVTAEMIEYWGKRGLEAINPILKARYLWLIWDFSYLITWSHPSHEIAEEYINALISVAEWDYHVYEYTTFNKLARALSISISLNKPELLKKIKKALIQYEKIHGDDAKPGLWWHVFDLLLDEKKIELSQLEEDSIIWDLEERLLRLTTKQAWIDNIDPWAAEAAARRLAKYYKRLGKREDVKRVILQIQFSYEAIIDEVSAMQAVCWLESLHELLKTFELQTEAEAILIKIREVWKKISDELNPISISHEIPKAEMEEYIQGMTFWSGRDILNRIASQYIPKKEEAKEQILDSSKTTVFMNILSQQIVDEKWRTVAIIGPFDSDPDGHIIRHISQSLSFSAIFLNQVFENAKSKKLIEEKDVMDLIISCPIIDSDRLEIIQQWVHAYFENNYLVFIHLIIPQIEEALRNMLELSGWNIYKTWRNWWYNLITFDKILSEEIIRKSLSEDFLIYFRILFTDIRGWNLRNNVMHWISSSSSFNSHTADRVMHALICLWLIKKQ